MQSRRAFLARTGSIVAGLTGFPSLTLTAPARRDRLAPLDLGLERAFVLFELRLFERHYLPGLLAPFCLDHCDDMPRLAFCHDHDHRLEQWQAATHRLAEALKVPRESNRPDLRLDEIRHLFTHHFILQVPAHRCFSARQGRIRWHIHPLGSIRPQPECRARDALHLLRGCFGVSLADAPGAADPCLQLSDLLPRIQELYRQLDPCSDAHFAAHEWLLPLLAEVDPSWAVQTLDRRGMEEAVRTDGQLSAAERDLRLGQLRDPFVSRYLGSAHARVMATLANNHFGTISGLLRHPEIYGSANSLMTESVFAVLYCKVEVLRQLRQ